MGTKRQKTHTKTKSNPKDKCVSRLARRKSHHTALSHAAAPNSECPPLLLLHAGARVHGANAHPGSNAAAAVTPTSQSSPKWEKICPDGSRTRVQIFRC